MAKARQSKRKSSHGGRRAGAGRKPNATTKLRSAIVAEADKLICDHLPQLVRNLITLADGGFQRVEEKFEPPVMLELVPKGGKPSKPPEPVLVERKVSTAEPDRAANQYLIDRVLGKARQAVEVSGVDGGPIAISLEAAIDKIYGDEEKPE